MRACIRAAEKCVILNTVHEYAAARAFACGACGRPLAIYCHAGLHQAFHWGRRRCISRAHSASAAPRAHTRDTADMAQSTAAAHSAENGHTDQHFWALALGSIGVVYGDIGTSPLYALREAVTAATKHGASGPDAVLGILSLIVWTMLLIVTLKYVLVLLNADNKGEGGTFALMALGQSVAKRSSPLLLVLGVVGRRLLLRRCGHHAGDLGAVGGGRPQARGAADGSGRAADHGRHSGRPVRRAIARDRKGGALLRPDNARLVHRARHRRADPHHRRPARVPGAQSLARRPLRADARRHRPGRHGPDLPGRHRRGGALRRSRPFRPQADPDRPGCGSCSRPSSSTTSARARCCWRTRRRSRTRSIGSIRAGR